MHAWQRTALGLFLEKHKLIGEVVTGAGKTFFAVRAIKFLLKDHPEFRVLIIVPKVVILEESWARELAQAGFGPDRVGAYYGKNKSFSQITLTTMASLTRLDHRMFDVVVFDELHNMYGERLSRIASMPFAYKLGLTATLHNPEAKHWNIIPSFDHNIFRYGIKQALKDNIIAKYDFIDVAVNEKLLSFWVAYDEAEQKIRELLASIGGMRGFYEMSADNKTRLSLLKWFSKRSRLVHANRTKLECAVELCVAHTDNRVLVFNEYNDSARELMVMLSMRGVRSMTFNSANSQTENYRALDEFRNGTLPVLIGTRALDEGYNLPSLDVVIIMSGNSTRRQMTQRVGRSLRKHGDKRTTIYQLWLERTIDERNAKKRSELLSENADSVSMGAFS